MKDGIAFEKVISQNLNTYIRVGKDAYCEHYRHLWKYGNPSPYVSGGFTLSALEKGLKNPKSAHYIIRRADMDAGILKMIQDRPVAPYAEGTIVFLEKIYLLRQFTGSGIGAASLRFIEEYGRRLQKAFIVLDAMQKGPAARFYLKEGFTVLREKQLEHPDAIPEECPMYVMSKPL